MAGASRFTALLDANVLFAVRPGRPPFARGNVKDFPVDLLDQHCIEVQTPNPAACSGA